MNERDESWPEGTPGSDKAVTAGCTCPVMDNAHGRGATGTTGEFYINEKCPIHSPRPSLAASHEENSHAD